MHIYICEVPKTAGVSIISNELKHQKIYEGALGVPRLEMKVNWRYSLVAEHQ